eukprot:m.9859 g.9859  ORF g.9859 m.9859 type:complete len:57 (+) comp3564_c0_seq1:700-870(+)
MGVKDASVTVALSACVAMNSIKVNHWFTVETINEATTTTTTTSTTTTTVPNLPCKD